MRKHIDFIKLFEARNFEFSRDGQHSVGNIGINCPFCKLDGDPDPSDHLGINVESGFWSCWRNNNHRGIKPHRLLYALFQMRYSEVDAMLGVSQANPGDFDSIFSQSDPFLLSTVFKPDGLSSKSRDELKLFVPINSGLASRHVKYLENRGISKPAQVSAGLLAGVVGKWASRIIFTIKKDDDVLTWTARKISAGVAGAKYLTLQIAIAAESYGGCSIKNFLWCPGGESHYENAGGVMFVVEGALDALNLSQYSDYPIVCAFGVRLSDEQTARLWNLSHKYSRIIFMFDVDAYAQSLYASTMLSNAEAFDISKIGVNDPGEIKYENYKKLESLLSI